MRPRQRSSTPHASRRSTWVRRAVGGAAVLLVVAAGVFAWLRSDTADPVTLDDVVDRFEGDGRAAPAELPEPGVYVYRSAGSESVDALGGSNHDYPRETTMTVTVDDAGCVTTRWDALRQRWDAHSVCPADDGAWRPRDIRLHHSFFRRGETREYTCTADSVAIPADLEPGTTFSSACDSEGSGLSGDTHQRMRGTVVAVEDIEIGEELHPAVHVRYRTTVSGETSGEGTIDRWFAVDRVPLVLREVSWQRNESETVIGTVTYEESYELEIESREPRT